MKYLDMVRGLQLIEDICLSSDINIDGADINLVKFQDGLNGKLRERLEITRGIEDAEVCITFTPNDEIIVEDLPKENDREDRYFTPEEVQKMTRKEVCENYTAIMKSVKLWDKERLDLRAGERVES